MAGNRLIYASSEHCADMLYATGLFTPDPFLWYQIGHWQRAILSSLEYGRALKTIKSGVDVMSLEKAKSHFSLVDNKIETMIAGISAYHGINTWTVPPEFPHGIAERVEAGGIEINSSSSAFFPQRECKDASAIQGIQAGVKLAEQGLECALAILKAAQISEDGLIWQGAVLSADRLRGEIESEIARQGGIAAYSIVACGIEGADPHNIGSGVINAHEPIIIDIFPRVTRTGYHGDLTRTVVKGQAASHIKAAFSAVRKARDTVIAMATARVNVKTLHQKVEHILEESGFTTDIRANPPRGFFHGTGHGLGLELHEAPSIGKGDYHLKTGNVFTVEPGLYYPEWGGIRLEDVIVIGKDGCKNLTTVPSILEIP